MRNLVSVNFLRVLKLFTTLWSSERPQGSLFFWTIGSGRAGLHPLEVKMLLVMIKVSADPMAWLPTYGFCLARGSTDTFACRTHVKSTAREFKLRSSVLSDRSSSGECDTWCGLACCGTERSWAAFFTPAPCLVRRRDRRSKGLLQEKPSAVSLPPSASAQKEASF